MEGAGTEGNSRIYLLGEVLSTYLSPGGFEGELTWCGSKSGNIAEVIADEKLETEDNDEDDA